MSVEAETLLSPVAGTSPKTPASAARSLALYVTGEPKLAASTLTRYVGIVREGFAAGTYSEDDWNAALGLEAGNPLGATVLRVLEDRASENDVVLEASKNLETVLKERHQAEGRGLHEYTSDIEGSLPDALTRTLRYIATVRNNVVHGDGSGLDGVHGRAKYALQAGRAYDWLVKTAQEANSESPVTGKPEFSGGRVMEGGMEKLEARLRRLNVPAGVGFGMQFLAFLAFFVTGSDKAAVSLCWVVGLAGLIIFVSAIIGAEVIKRQIREKKKESSKKRQLVKA